MTYCKTKYGVFPYRDNGQMTGKVRVLYGNGNESDDAPIIAISDKVIDLCDALIGITKNGKRALLTVDAINVENNAYAEIYGGVWTDMGFIYCAKRNEWGWFNYHCNGKDRILW